MPLTRVLNAGCLLASCLLASVVPLGGAMAQQCAPCAAHCAMLGSAANAACVQSGIDPVICGGGKPKVVPPDNMSLSAPSVTAAGGPGCTAQGICYRAGLGAQAACLASCFICTPSIIHPDFLLISILYAPPGNASTASFGQSNSSGTTYAIGSNVSETESATVSISEAFSVTDGEGAGFSLSLQSGSSSGGGYQFSAVTTATKTGVDNLKPGKDALDHTQDIFLLWLNPVVTLTKSDQKTLSAAITSGEVQMSVQTVSASQLMHGIPAEKLAPTKICPTPNTCYTLPGLGSLTQADINAILAQDPFLNATPGQTPDQSRFTYVQSNPLENTTVAANVTQAFTVSDAQTTTSTTTQTSGSSEGITTGVSVKAFGVGIGLTDSNSWTWTETVSHGASSGQMQQASVTLASTTQNCCGINNSVTCEVSIWEDMIYRTFVFLPQPETCQDAITAAAPKVAAVTTPTGSAGPSLSGTVMQGGTPARGATVVISDATGKALSRIVTDHLGRYFSGGLPPGQVSVRVGSQTLQTTIVTGQGAVVDLKL